MNKCQTEQLAPLEARRRSIDVVNQLLHALAESVTTYHPEVRPTGTTFALLVAGTSCFPGGAGLWRGEENGGDLPGTFPHDPVMFVGHNFDSQRAYAASIQRKGEGKGVFWQRLLGMLRVAGLAPEDCFFTNALMGVKPGSATGPMPSVPGYREQCRTFLAKQVEIVKPRALVALGVKAEEYVRCLPLPHIAVKHPSHWDFRAVATRSRQLAAEGEKLASFLQSSSASGK